MNLRLISACAVMGAAATLSGCVSFGQTDMLVTPVGVAGIHSFAPPASPDNFKQIDREAQRLERMAQQRE